MRVQGCGVALLGQLRGTIYVLEHVIQTPHGGVWQLGIPHRLRTRYTSTRPAPQTGDRQQIAKALEGDPRAALKARVVLRDLVGKVRLVPGPEETLWAEFKQHPAALLLRGAGTCGSGGPLW